MAKFRSRTPAAKKAKSAIVPVKKAGQRRVTKWPIGEEKMAVVPVLTTSYRRGRLSSTYLRRRITAVNKKYFAVLLEKTGSKKYKVIKQFFVPYDTPKLGQRVLEVLATKEFGLTRAPERLPTVPLKYVSGLKTKSR